MSIAREEDLMESIPIPVKALIPVIPRDDKELQELVEDLRIMGCEGLLAKPWNLQSKEILRELSTSEGINGSPQRGEIRKVGRHMCETGSTCSQGVSRKGGQVAG